MKVRKLKMYEITYTGQELNGRTVATTSFKKALELADVVAPIKNKKKQSIEGIRKVWNEPTIYVQDDRS
jgi:hypothetical protein